MNLTEEEERVVDELLGTSNKRIFAGIAELMLSKNAQKEDWMSIVRPGVVCFIKDLDKKAYYIWILDLTNGVVAWKQNMDTHIKCQRRRRWIYVMELGYRKMCLNFVDDDEADEFAYVLFEKFPKFQEFAGTIPYTVSNDGKIIRNLEKASAARRVSREENLKKFLNVAGLDPTVLDDPKLGEQIFSFYEEYEDELADILDEDNAYDIGEDDEKEGQNDEGSEIDYGDNPLVLDGDEPESTNGSEDRQSSSSSMMLDTISEGEDEETVSTPPNTSLPAPSKNAIPPPPPPIQMQIPKSVQLETKKPIGSRLSLLDQIRGNNKQALKKVDSTNARHELNKRLTKAGNNSIEDVLFGAMAHIRSVKASGGDYGLEQETYREWDDD